MTSKLASNKSLQPQQTIERKYSSQVLFGGKQVILIEHDGHTYHLRITRQNKLILTK